MKKCLFCGEEIQDTATKCRFCGEWLAKKEVHESDEKIKESLCFNTKKDFLIKKIALLICIIISLFVYKIEKGYFPDSSVRFGEYIALILFSFGWFYWWNFIGRWKIKIDKEYSDRDYRNGVTIWSIFAIFMFFVSLQ